MIGRSVGRSTHGPPEQSNERMEICSVGVCVRVMSVAACGPVSELDVCWVRFARVSCPRLRFGGSKDGDQRGPSPPFHRRWRRIRHIRYRIRPRRRRRGSSGCRRASRPRKAVVSPSVILVAGGLGVAAIDVSDPPQARRITTTTSGVATREGGSHVSLYGDRQQYYTPSSWSGWAWPCSRPTTTSGCHRRRDPARFSRG